MVDDSVLKLAAEWETKAQRARHAWQEIHDRYAVIYEAATRGEADLTEYEAVRAHYFASKTRFDAFKEMYRGFYASHPGLREETEQLRQKIADEEHAAYLAKVKEKHFLKEILAPKEPEASPSRFGRGRPKVASGTASGQVQSSPRPWIPAALTTFIAYIITALLVLIPFGILAATILLVALVGALFGGVPLSVVVAGAVIVILLMLALSSLTGAFVSYLLLPKLDKGHRARFWISVWAFFIPALAIFSLGLMRPWYISLGLSVISMIWTVWILRQAAQGPEAQSHVSPRLRWHWLVSALCVAIGIALLFAFPPKFETNTTLPQNAQKNDPQIFQEDEAGLFENNPDQAAQINPAILGKDLQTEILQDPDPGSDVKTIFADHSGQVAEQVKYNLVASQDSILMVNFKSQKAAQEAYLSLTDEPNPGEKGSFKNIIAYHPEKAESTAVATGAIYGRTVFYILHQGAPKSSPTQHLKILAALDQQIGA